MIINMDFVEFLLHLCLQLPMYKLTTKLAMWTKTIIFKLLEDCLGFEGGHQLFPSWVAMKE